jgi:hypothetical protein
MTLAGTQRIDGREQKVRAVWYLQKDGVRETAEFSSDGKTWKPLFDIVFRPHKA